MEEKNERRTRQKPLLTAEIADDAVNLVRPMIELAMRTGRFKRKAIAVEVLDPTKRRPTVLYKTRIVLNEKDWQDRFETIAHQKCLLADRTGMDTAKVMDKCAHLLLEGDTKYQGGVNRNGIVVGCSGGQSHYDQLFAGSIADAINTICVDIYRTQIRDADGDNIELPEAA